MIIKSNIGIDALVNEEEIPCKSCVNLHKGIIEVLDTEEELKEEHLLIPTSEELYPYNRCMYDFLGGNTEVIPKGMSASHYLRCKQMMIEFYTYRRSAVIHRLTGWLLAREIHLQYEELCE